MKVACQRSGISRQASTVDDDDGNKECQQERTQASCPVAIRAAVKAALHISRLVPDKEAVKRGERQRWKIEAIPFYSICAVMQIMCESVQTSKGLPVKKWPTYEFLRQLGKRAADLMVGWLAKTHASGNCLTKAGTVTYTQLHRHATLVYVLSRPSLCQVSVCIK